MKQTYKLDKDLIRLVLKYHKTLNQVLSDFDALLDDYDKDQALVELEEYYRDVFKQSR